MECKLCANDSEHGPGFCCFLGCGPGVGASGAFEGTPCAAGHIEYRAWARGCGGEVVVAAVLLLYGFGSSPAPGPCPP